MKKLSALVLALLCIASVASSQNQPAPVVYAANSYLANPQNSPALPVFQTIPTGANLASPGPIGNTTPSTGAFTTLSATGNLTTNITGGGTVCVHASNTGVLSAASGDCAAGVSSSSPNSWTAAQTFTNSDLLLLGSSTGATTFTSDNAGASNFTLHVPAANDTVAVLGTFAAPPAIGSGTPAGGAFTTLSASSTVSGTGFSTYLASPPAIGGSAAAAGSFTTLSASSTVSGTGFSTYLASPPAIGGSAAAAGSFTTLSASSTVSGSGFSTYLASPPAIGGSAPAAGAFTTLSATGAVSSPGILSTGTKFTVAGTGCTPSSTTGGATAGTITLAATCTSIVITMNGATGLTAANGWTCSVRDRTLQAAGTYIPPWFENSSTTTTATIPIPPGAGTTDVIAFSCTGY